MAKDNENWQEALNRITKAERNKLKALDLPWLQLTQLPLELFQLDNLKELSLWFNELTKLPPEVTKLTQLTELRLSYNQLSALPHDFSNLQQLTYLNLNNNKFSALPHDFSNLQQLTILDLSSNELSSLPQNFANLQNLTKLDLRNNQLSALPHDFSNLQQLTYLVLSSNQLSALPQNFANLQNLTKLDLRNNQLSALPHDFSNLQQLTCLVLSNNKFSALPHDFANLQQLTYLVLSSNQLSALPHDFANLQNLTKLDLRNNQLSALPHDFSNLQNLTKLDLRNNQLSALPHDFSNLQNLTILDLSNNQLSALPHDFSNLQNLTILDLSNNKFSASPSTITQLEKLKRLDLGNNQLQSLPSEITQLRHLDIVLQEYFSGEGINLYGNEKTLQHPPMEIIQQGWDAIENYFQQIEKNRDKLYEAKLIFIGEGRAGKTSLMRALLGKPFNKNESSTQGIEIASVMLSKEETDFEKDFRLNLWDFGGQEIYKDTHRFFLTKDTIYILVTENRKNINYDDIYYWLNGINIFAPDAPVLLVQNKCEENIEDLPFQKYKRDFSNLVPWSDLLRTSCVAGKEGSITKLRQAIVRVLQDKSLAPNVGDDIPATWVDIRADLAKIQQGTSQHWLKTWFNRVILGHKTTKKQHEGQPTLSYASFKKLCMERYGLKDELSVKTLAGYFFRIGVFTHYEDNLTLEGTIFLDNEWLTKGVYRIIDSQIVKDNEGRFTTTDLKALYKGTAYEGLEGKFAELMNEFKICYRVAKNEYLCPLRLPVEQPESFKLNKWQRAENLHYAFKYPFMPRGILTTFIVNIHAYIIGESWRHGVVLQHNQAQALVYEDLQAKYIHIYIKGEGKRDFLAIIVSKLQDIHKELNNLRHEAKIACSCAECMQNPAKAYLFDEERIMRCWHKGIETVQCNTSDANVSVEELAGFIKKFYKKPEDNRGTSIGTVEKMTVISGISTHISESTVHDVNVKENQVHNSQA